MGKLGPRLTSRKKAKRWIKGQSSSCNPQIQKHREQATRMFFKEFCSTPGITKEDLQKHDAIQGIQLENPQNIDEDYLASTVDGTVNTFETFASNYSSCSNISFTRFLSHFQSSSIVHKEMLAVLSAVTEIIKQNGGNETSTEYFAALMSTLEAVEDDTSIAATISLLGMSLKTVPKNVLNVQFGLTSQALLQILSKYASTDNFLILRHCISCLSILLRAQEAAIWINPSTVQVLDAILSFTTHAKPKVRKSAQHGICAVLKGSDVMKNEKPLIYHPAAGQVAIYCIKQLNVACEPGGITTILHILTLLKDIIHQLPKSHVKTICEGLLKIMTLKNVLITSCCLQTLHGLFLSRPSEATLPSQRNAQIITALYEYQPSATDTQPMMAWLAVMQEAHCNLAHTSLDLCAAVISRMLEKCIELWLSDKTEVISGASHTIKTILQECVAPLCENDEQIKKYNAILSQIISMLHKALSYQYLEAWHHVLHLIALLFQITGKLKTQGLLNIISTLGQLRDSYNFAYNNDVEYAIGAAIRAMGPHIVLNVLPLQTGNVINLKRSWLIPLLKDCITCGTISFFTNTLLPIATICEQKTKQSTGDKAYELIIPQIWSILPSICNDAGDVKTNFKSIAKILGLIISDKKDLKLPVMAALRKLINKATQDKNTDDIAQLAWFAKNYLPILFNLYTTEPIGTDEEGQRLAAFDTIKIYITITDKDLVNELFDRSINKLNESNANDYFKESIYDLIRILIGYTDVDKLKQYYDMCMPILKDNAKPKEQKKAYRFLEEICGSDKEVCKQFVQVHRRDIQKTLISSATTVIQTSKGARLRCLTHLAKTHPQLKKTKFLEAIIPETVLGVKDINERCRNSAYQLINIIAEKFLENPEYFKDYTAMLMVGIGGNQKYCSATLLALASITYHYNGSLGIETVKDILKLVCSILTGPTREIVESALSYVKVYISVMPSPIIASTLTEIIKALSQMHDNCKRHFRQKVRDIFTKLIRKYSIGVISGMVPVSDTILHKRLKNINKIEDTKRKNRELKRMKKLENNNDDEFDVKRKPKSIEEILADSDEEFEDIENKESKGKNKKRTSRKEAWIQENEENIIDLIDPAAARNITTTQPGLPTPRIPIKKINDHGFKTAPDGRLIITDNNEKDSDTENKKKKKTPFPQNDSEDDYDEDDKSIATTRTINKKRKYSESVDAISLKSQSTSKYQAGGSGIHRPLKARKIERIAGSDYRATKAGGDIKRKGKPDPYAYVPLRRSTLNKRKKKKNESKLQSIICGSKKGVRIGKKNKQRRH